jgi:hypothetical protein
MTGYVEVFPGPLLRPYAIMIELHNVGPGDTDKAKILHEPANRGYRVCCPYSQTPTNYRIRIPTPTPRNVSLQLWVLKFTIYLGIRGGGFRRAVSACIVGSRSSFSLRLWFFMQSTHAVSQTFKRGCMLS